MILILLLFGMVVCLDPVDIDLLQPLNIPGIRTQQVTFYGIEYLIIDPDPGHFINTVRYGNNLMFQKNENNSCLKIVRVNNGVHSFLYLRVITPANQDIQLRFFLQDGPPVLGRMSPTVTTVNTVMRYAANLHPSLNPRGFNIFDNPLPLDEDEGDSDGDDSDGDEGGDEGDEGDDEDDDGDEGPEGGEGDDGDEGPEGGDGAVDEGIDHDFDQDIDDVVSGILGVGDLPNAQAALGVDQEGIQGMIGGLNQFIPNLPEIPEQDEPEQDETHQEPVPIPEEPVEPVESEPVEEPVEESESEYPVPDESEAPITQPGTPVTQFLYADEILGPISDSETEDLFEQEHLEPGTETPVSQFDPLELHDLGIETMEQYQGEFGIDYEPVQSTGDTPGDTQTLDEIITQLVELQQKYNEQFNKVVESAQSEGVIPVVQGETAPKESGQKGPEVVEVELESEVESEGHYDIYDEDKTDTEGEQEPMEEN